MAANGHLEPFNPPSSCSLFANTQPSIIITLRFCQNVVGTTLSMVKYFLFTFHLAAQDSLCGPCYLISLVFLPFPPYKRLRNGNGTLAKTKRFTPPRAPVTPQILFHLTAPDRRLGNTGSRRGRCASLWAHGRLRYGGFDCRKRNFDPVIRTSYVPRLESFNQQAFQA